MATPSHTPPRHALIKAHQAFDGENMVGSCVTEVVDGIICDGHQVDAANLKTAFRAKGRNRLMLVTDAMATVGSDQSHFMLQGRPIRLEAGRLVDQHGTLAGAHLSMIDAVHNAVQAMKIRLEDALIMVSRTPACFLGFGDNLGRMTPGYSANLVAFAGRDVLQTWINGNAAMQKRDRAEGDKRL